MTLTLIIPVRNDTTRLRRLLSCAAQLGCADRIIVVDDASDVPVTPADILPAGGTLDGKLTLIRNDQRRGPGACRNMGAAQVTTSHLLFVDSDDLITPELVGLMDDLSGKSFDFCLFKHADSRVEDDGGWGQTPYDEEIWQRAGVAVGALHKADPTQAGILSQTANYPWNKLYRTGFLRKSGARCTDILLHEDIELHWKSFLRARKILVSDRIGVIHFVIEDGDRLTQRRGAERLAAFGPLTEIAAQVRTRRGPEFNRPFLRFASDLLGWIKENLEPDLHPDLMRHVQAFLLDQLDGQTPEELLPTDPYLAGQIAAQLQMAEVYALPSKAPHP